MGVRLTLFLTSATPRIVEAVLEGLVRASVEQMRRHPLPPLYSSGVRYERERGRESWQTAEETVRRRRGDCEDLAAYRAAELRVAGESRARAICYSPRPGLIHCVVRRANGRIEDPSRRLGMKGKG